MKVQRYHFSLGNSSQGPVGFCAAAHAASPEEAVAALQANLAECADIHARDSGEGIEYIAAYFNAPAITVDDIDDVTDLEPAQDDAFPRAAH
jgi:hypothetical protein